MKNTRLVTSLNLDQNKKLSDLEMFFLVTQGLIQKQLKNGKKGKKLSSTNRITYEAMQQVLYTLYAELALKGCFSFGICETCTNFDNSAYSEGTLGKCNGKEVHCFHTCNKHSEHGGGFGL